jgi:hypothetical protein
MDEGRSFYGRSASPLALTERLQPPALGAIMSRRG